MTKEARLLVSRFWYIRSVDPRTALLTGLTRDGVWFIEKGKIQYPVHRGLKRGEVVVTSGASFLYDGQPVEVLQNIPIAD